jgi:hypothetical protein
VLCSFFKFEAVGGADDFELESGESGGGGGGSGSHGVGLVESGLTLGSAGHFPPLVISHR